MRIVGLLLATMAAMVGVGSNFSALIDVPSAIIVFGGLSGLLMFGGTNISAMFRGLSPGSLSSEELRLAAKGWKLARYYALAMGMIGTMIGWIIMLKNMDNVINIGPGMAIALLTVLYGLVVSFGICLPLQVNIERRVADTQDGSVFTTGVLAGLLTIIVTIVSIGTMLFTFRGSTG